MISISGYEIKEKLYRSSMSLIFRGKRESNEQPVILKVLKREYPTQKERARFKAEYEITRSFDSSGIIKVYSYKPYKHTSVIILEDFGGDSLNNYLAAGRFKLKDFLKLAVKISDILGEVHLHNAYSGQTCHPFRVYPATLASSEIL
jgi:serine/threonine protein kinase